MSIAVSPAPSDAASPMITSVTPTLDPDPKESPGGSGRSRDGELQDSDNPNPKSYQKPPPLHTGADWKVVLHLPEIETWLRATADRVRDLTHSVQQDSLNRHVDVHLVQLKDICEDISDHVEQIHALLETEFSLKLLSYSVNIIVDIRSVQLLWHQLRVSVLVLKERLLQGLQDSNGNYTRQTDILQAFHHEHDQARLDSLTEVDDSGQLTIKCSQDYFSLDCGITAYELSDYSPSEDPEGRGLGQEPRSFYPELERDFPELLQSVDLLTIAASRQSQESSPPAEEPNSSAQDPSGTQSGPMDQDPPPASAMPGSSSSSLLGESSLGISKRPLQGSHNNDVSPTQPSRPKKPMYVEGEARNSRPSSLEYKADISRSTPSLLDMPDRSKFWLELESIYPGNGSHSDENLHVMNGKNRQVRHQGGLKKHQVLRRGQIPLQRSSSEAGDDHANAHTYLHSGSKSKRSQTKHANSDSSSPLPSSSGEEMSDHDPRESSSSPDNRPTTTDSLWIVSQSGSNTSQTAHSPKEECWYGSEEFLALPAQLRKTEMLALNLENLAQALPPRNLQQPLQDVDDWELTEANLEWEASPQLLPHQSFKKHFLAGRFSSSSSDVAPSVDESIESGPLSDLLSEDEVGWSGPESRRVERNAGQPRASSMMLQCTPLIQQLLEDIQHQENYQDIWGKIEGFVSKLDEFICWLREALESTENWTPPRADTDSLRVYMETHLSFKLNVDSHSALKDSLLEEGRQLLELITSHKSGLRDILQMIAHQWQELQRQVRRQHSWMLHSLDTIKAQVLASESSQILEDSGPYTGPKAQVQQCHTEAQRDILDQMNVKLQSQQYSFGSSRNRDVTLMAKFNSLSEFEAEYRELWDWLMDMESAVTDSHELMMSEEQQKHLYKGNSVEMAMWLPKKTQLLGWAESLKRSSTELPGNFEERITALKSKWQQLEKVLGEHTEVRVGESGARGLLSPGTSSMVAQLESRIKELKNWLRDTELFIFNLNLRAEPQHQDRTPTDPNLPTDPDLHPRPDPGQSSRSDQQAAKQLEHFKALCAEVRGRRKGMASVLRLCQRLLDGPEDQSSEADRQSLQLLQVNLERRWEAIVMQVLQWQNRLKRSLGREQVPGNLIEPSLMDLRGQTEDSWEWDEMDMTMVNMEAHESDEQRESSPLTLGDSLDMICPTPSRRNLRASESKHVSSHVYQVYSLHTMDLYQQPQYNQEESLYIPKTKVKQPLLKSLSKDSSFSSVESLTDIIGGLVSGKQNVLMESARRSESESGIVSEGDTETTANSEVCLLYQSDDPKVQVSLTPPCRTDSPCIEIVSDEDIDRILERANKCAELESCLAEEAKDQRYCMVWKKREGSGENRRNRHKKEHVEILINGRCLSPESEDEGHDTGTFSTGAVDEGKNQKNSTQLSQGSSLDSLYLVGELFPSAKETLTRSTSLESWLAPCKSSEEAGSQGSLGDLGLAPEPTGELSRRTLDLLKRLENIQSPLAQKMTRSISDVTLQTCSLQVLGQKPHPGGAPSSVNESLGASLTELSTFEDSSVASEDLAVQRNRCKATADSNASFRKHCRNHQLTDETDASVSMVVNVSCTSACTDDEDDSDLLSSSTLTLTEEELGIKDDEDSSLTSEEEYIEGSFALGMDYMKGEFQSWMKPRSQSREKNEADLGDELQCGTLSREIPSPMRPVSDRRFLSCAALKLLEANTNAKNDSLNQQEVDINRRDATRNYISCFVDDMENGNVDSSHIKGKDEDDELLREEGSLITKKGESFKDHCMEDLIENVSGMVTATTPSSCEQLNLQSKESSLEGQLKGELPCHSSRRLSPSLSPMDECSESHHGMLGAAPLNTKEQLVSFLKDVHDDSGESSADCCSQPCFPSEEEKNENVHNFVMEIIDMASVALKTKEALREPAQEVSNPASVSQIREKVLEHSHRPIHLRKGDFYSYLSLSSHDSDCGEVSTCTEDRSSTPVLSRTPEIHDEELLFEACTEEVYLGPPLCYSMSISKRPTRRSTKLIDPFCPLSQAPPPACDEYQKAHGISPGTVAGSQPECHNEASYLNPLPCETLIDTVECFADTKMLESNISPVMTKIRVSCSSTNPLKEEGGLYINPKINCPPIRKSDRDERGAASQWMKQKNVKKGRSSPQEAKSTHKQTPRSESGAGLETGRRASLGTRHPDSSSAVRSGASSRPQARVRTTLLGSLAGPACKP